MLHALADEGVGTARAMTCVRLWREAGAPDRPAAEGDGDGLGPFLRRSREALGHSQRLVAAQIGVPQAQLSRWEAGESLPDAGELAALLDAFQLSPDARGEAHARAHRMHVARLRRAP